MKRIITLMLAFLTLIALLTACDSDHATGKNKNRNDREDDIKTSSHAETEIQSDLKAYIKTNLLAENEKIVEINVDRQQTEKDEKLDTVWCTVIVEDDRCSYEKGFVLTYTIDDEESWLLDKVTVNNRNEWVITPITGVSEEEIAAALNGVTISVDDEIWTIKKDNIKRISVDSRETDLKGKTDIVTVSLVIDDLVEEASGQIVIRYTFKDEWIADSMSGNDSFSASTKPGIGLNITDEMLINALSDNYFEYGVGETQDITIKKNEISDFIIDSQELSDRGRTAKYHCRFTLTKPHAGFTVEAIVVYNYYGEWAKTLDSVTAKCTSVELSGVWTGLMYDKLCELNITEMTTDGTMSGVFTYYDGVGSYYVSGKIDLNTLRINLVAGDEIKVGIDPFGLAYGTSDIIAQLSVDDSTISGTARRSFTVTQ